MSDYLDPAYEWVEVVGFGDHEPRFIKGSRKPCPHTSRVPVESTVNPETIVAQLCLDCDVQLSPNFHVEPYHPRYLLPGS